MRVRLVKKSKKAVGLFKKPYFRKLLILSLASIILYFIFAILSVNRVLFNTYLGSQNVGGLKVKDAKFVLNERLAEFEGSVATFVLEDKIVEIGLSDLGIRYETEATFEKFYIMGRLGNLIRDLILNFKSPFALNQVRPVYTIDVLKLESFVESNFSEDEEAAYDAQIVIETGGPRIREAKNGSVIDKNRLVSDLLARLDKLSSEPIEIVKTEQLPKVESGDLAVALEEYKSLIGKRVVLVFGFDSWRLEGEALVSILKILPVGYEDGYIMKLIAGDSTVLVTRVLLADSSNFKVNVEIDDVKIGEFLSKISGVINRDAVNATAIFENGKISQFTPAIDGQKLDIEETRRLILDNVFAPSDSKKPEIAIKLPVVVTVAKIANEEINSLGIRELIGRGVSYFSGSIANRIFNIELGAKRINGTLVAPGDVFSFNKTVREVSGKTGYKQAYVISSGRTVLDDGGGICQVSTTIFRAAVNSGLPIVSRTAHAYRVGYYEQRGFGPGLDATVFAPAVDFQFKNDTANYILVQSVFSRANSMLEIDIYGTKDGRVVEVSRPVVSNRIPAPPDKYQDEPTLPKGTIKQIDFAAEGADAYFTRKVYKNDQLLFDDVFKSRFRPWQAIYLVGTGG